MRHAATTILALVSCAGLFGCATLTGGNVATEMIVANHTAQPITVSFGQNAYNTGSNPFGVRQTVTPDGTIRFSGKEGDELVVTAGDEPPMVLIFAKRCQVVKVSDEDGQVSVDLRRGYTDPSK
jgi:hypothetical protein